MEKKFPISEAIIRTHKCCLCGHLLSVPPIRSSGLEKELYRCGRCEKVKCQTYTRNRLFENVAQYLSFPCSYDECDKRISWGKVEEHEQNCPHRTMRCPLYYHNCSEQLRVDKLPDHFRDKHSANFKATQSTWDLKTQYDYVFLTHFDNQHFLVYVLHLEGIFSIAVLALERTKYSKFNAKLLPCTGNKFAIYFDDLPVFRYDERSHCYRCARKKCQELYHPFSEKVKSEEMDLSLFTSKLKRELIDSVTSTDGSIRYYITLQADESSSEHPDRVAENEEEGEGEQGEEQGAAAAASNIPDDINTQALRRALTCPYCMTYMAAPIFTCLVGHTICNVCRPRLSKCPVCAEPFGNSRNYTLEEIAKDVKMPCQYKSNGCDFTGSSAKMYIHEEVCAFSDL